MADHVHLEGWLVKRTIKSGRAWKRRYFVLNRTTLLYFRNKGDAKPRGEIVVSSGSFVKISQTKANALELSTNREVLIICADTAEEQSSWLRSLEYAILIARKDKENGEGRESLEEESKSSSAQSFAGGLFNRLTKARRRHSTNSTGGYGNGAGRQDRASSSGGVPMAVDEDANPFGNALRDDSSTMEEDVDSHVTSESNNGLLTHNGGLLQQRRESTSSRGSYGGSMGPVIERRPVHKFSTPTSMFEVDVRYKFIRPIGTGAYGVVVSAHDEIDDDDVAIKKVGKAFEDLVDAKRILREIKLLRHFDHENVIHIKDLLTPRSYEDFEDIYIVSELMETDLHRVIYSKQRLSEDHIQYFVYQTLRALKYIHSANVIHRDLKPSNLLLNANCDLKVCDFGLARGLEDTQLALTEYVVTRWYRAPEIMLACREYTKSIDVWAVGCIFAEMLGRKPAFPGEDYIHQLQLIIDVLGTPSEADMLFIKSEKAKRFMRSQPLRAKCRLNKMYPDARTDGLDLLDKMLQFNPAKRITVEAALQHPYLATLHQPDDEPVCDRVFLFDDNVPDDKLTKRSIQDQILVESLAFHPEDRPRLERDAMRSKVRSAYFPAR